MTNTLLSSEKCLTQAVSRGYQLSDTLTLTGTPAIFTEKGTQISGYVPAHELLTILKTESK
jgi:protein-disulfide isomerase